MKFAFALFISILVLATTSIVLVTAQSDKVISLDGIGTLKDTVYSGYVEVNPKFGANLFYVFVQSRSANPYNDPVVVWLQGGPGCSSLFGMFIENGPWMIQLNNTFTNNPFSWNTFANILYLDQPVGSGFSYVRNPLGYVTNEKTVAQEAYTAISTFLFKLHPEYNKAPFYIAGESYAGKYIPSIATAIMNANKDVSNPKINLQALSMGDGWVHPYIQTGSYAPFLFQNKLISAETLAVANKTYNRYKELLDNKDYIIASIVGNGLLESLVVAAGNIDVYDIRLKTDPTDALGDKLATYLNQASVKQQLHAGSHHWSQCATSAYFALLDDEERSVESLMPTLLSQYRVLLYNGNVDLICNMIGTTEWSNTINWPAQSEYVNAKWNSWTVAGTSAGQYRKASSLTHLIIYNAGHMCPFNQPRNTLDMLSRLITNNF